MTESGYSGFQLIQIFHNPEFPDSEILIDRMRNFRIFQNPDMIITQKTFIQIYIPFLKWQNPDSAAPSTTTEEATIKWQNGKRPKTATPITITFPDPNNPSSKISIYTYCYCNQKFLDLTKISKLKFKSMNLAKRIKKKKVNKKNKKKLP